MSQPGHTEPSSSSSAAMAGDKPSLAPAKVVPDDEAEEGEILDEEEGEISEARPSETTGVAAPIQPASVDTTEPSQASSKQPSTPELPTSTTLEPEPEGSVQVASEVSTTQAPVDDALKPAAQPSSEAEPTHHVQAPETPKALDPLSEAFTGNPSDGLAPQELSEEHIPADAPASASIADVAAEPQNDLQNTTIMQQPHDSDTPKVTEARAEPEQAAAAPSEPQQEGIDVHFEDGHEDVKDVPETTTITEAAPEAEAQPAPAVHQNIHEAAEEKEQADMEVDEKTINPDPPANNEQEKPSDTVEEPMQVDDSIDTPALPSDGVKTPAEATTEPAEDVKQDSEAAPEAVSPNTHVKSEAQPEVHEEPPSKPAQVAETALPEPVDDSQPSGAELAEQDRPSTSEVVAEPHSRIQPEPPIEARHESPSSHTGADVPSSQVSRSEEPSFRTAAEGDERSASRLASAEPLQSRTAARGSAAPSTVHEKRVERSKERLTPSERSQDREQRAREKDRRRELERIERERERERERIRESERDREMMIARENEEARLIWLSLPGNDHPQYYTDTDSDSCYGLGGALGVELTDEEDKDLDPPLPWSLQEYHPAPSQSQFYFDDSYYAVKRKRIDDFSDESHNTSTRRSRRKPLGRPAAADRFDSSGSRPIPRDALPSTAMIDIDDFPVADSSIREEPSERPFASRIERASLPRISPYTRSEDAIEEYETSDSDEEALHIAEERKRRHGNRGGNRGNKLSRAKGVRWARRGKLGGWTETRMEKEISDRVRHRVEAMQKDNVRALLSAMPKEDKAMLAQFPALRDGLLPHEAPNSARRDARGRIMPSDLSEAARIDAELGLDGGATGASGSRLERPEHLTSTSLAPTLLKPAITPRQLLTSHTLRHTFRNPHIAALGKTALDLIESEGVVGRAVGRCWAAMERGGWNVDPEPKADELDEVEAAELSNGVLTDGMNVDASDAESPARPSRSQQNGGEVANGASSSLFGSAIDNPALSHLDKLFVTKQGLAIPRLDDMGQPIFVPPSPATQTARAQAGMTEDATNEAVIETTLLPAPEQRSIVLAALECLHDLAADSREYVERLEEVRSRLAAVKRRRAQVWNAVRQWALDKDIEASLANGGREDQDGAFKSGAEATNAAAAAMALSSAATAATTAVANGGSPKKRK